MANELYRTYEVLVEESVHHDHPKRVKTNKDSLFNEVIDGALRDTHMIFQDAVCYNTLCFAGLVGTHERDGELLNPLWKHLITPRREGGIKDETERVIRRLATHYAPLKELDRDGVTAEDFVNLVYSEPLQTRADMTPEELQAVFDLRARCYRILVMFGAPVKENGKQECADMSAFANTWAGLTSKPESDTEIPGNLAYDRVCRELKVTLKDTLSEAEAAALIEQTLLDYSAKAEDRNKKDCKQDLDDKLEQCKAALGAASSLPDSDGERAAKIKQAEADLKKHEDSAASLAADFFKNRRDGLKKAVVSALEKPLAADKAADLGVSDDDFSAAETYLETLHVLLSSSHDVESASDKVASATKQRELNEEKAAELKQESAALADAQSANAAEMEKLAGVERNKAEKRTARLARKLEINIASATKLRDSDAKNAGKLEKAEAELAKAQSASAAALATLEETERSWAERLAARLARKVEMEAHGFIRLHYKGGNPGLFEKAMFRYWLLRDHENEAVRRVVLADFRKFVKDDKPDEEPRLDGVHIAEMPFKSKGANVAFPLFGKKCLGLPTNHSSPDWDLDKVAYATAAEDVFKYKIRSDERKKRVRRLLNVVEAYENNGATLAAEHSPTGKALTVRGMASDRRWKSEAESERGIVQLLVNMGGEKKIGTYGLREGTIGGWAEVRKAFLSLHKKARGEDGKVPDENELPKKLVDAVNKEMEANRQGFGSADFFHELCEPAHFHLWLNGTEGEKKNGITDFIPHYVGYCEWREELVGLLIKDDGNELERETELTSVEMAKLAKRPIRYTWPGLLNRHKKPSYRYYDFAGDLNTAFQFKSLFRRVRTMDAEGKPTGPVERYEKLTDDKAKVTLAARRLKRDKIINKDTGNSVDALWCPPLILAGEPQPTTANRPRAGKYEDAKKKVWPKDKDAEVSFSLMAAPLPKDPWMIFAGDAFQAGPIAEPVHLTVSFKIEANALAALQNEGVHFVGGSLKGVDEEDEKRRFFRWPIDIETDKTVAKEAEAKAKRAAKEAGTEYKKPTRKADIAPGKLWCGSGDGFQVKASRYSKAEDTKTVPEFHILGVDLGNRFAAAVMRLRIHSETDGSGREISAGDGTRLIKAEMKPGEKLCLQGEGAKSWDHVRNEDGTCKKDAAGNYLYALEDETYGNGGRGRFPTDAEYQDAFVKLAGRLVPVESLSLSGTDKQTYPELGDHLCFRLKRRIGRLRTLFNLVWRLCGKYERDNRTGKQDKPRTEQDWLFHRRMTVETLARSMFPKRPRQPDEKEEPADVSLRATLAADEQWQKLKDGKLLDSLKGAAEKKRQADLVAALKDGGAWRWDALADEVKKQIGEYMEGPDSLDRLLVAVIEFSLPLKGRHWRWQHNPSGERLSWDERGSSADWNPNVMGMRGLSMKRLEQILNLRQRCQSFAKLEDRYHGPFKAGNYNPPDSSRDELPDSCPLVLERSNRIREQRVDQTAHLLLAEALGMELKNPAEVANKKERKAELDLHGEYKRRLDKNGKPYPRCSVIVLENLERYRTSQERTKAENSRLMKWAHRAIIEKLEDMCRPFGITLMLVDPAFSSHFDSRTGLPGVRCEEVPPGFDQTYPYNRWAEGTNKSGGETQLAKDIKALAKSFAEHPEYKGNLVLAVEGGKLFCPVLPPDGDSEALINADICAAGNIGLRGVADPQRWDIFPRLRTKQISETEVCVTNWRGWFGRFPQETKDNKSEQRRMRAVASVGAPIEPAVNSPAGNAPDDNAESQSSQSSEYPPFFVEHPERDWLPEGDWLKGKAFSFQQNAKTICAFRQGEYLKRVEQVCSERIKAINQDRLRLTLNT